MTGAKTLEKIVDAIARREAAELRRLFAKSRAERRYEAILGAAAIRPMGKASPKVLWKTPKSTAITSSTPLHGN
ncbi:MAG: hypothetical protein QXP98_08370 [Thermoproteus sp.]